MFGYVKPCERELKVKELAFYKSVYCGLCRTMSKKICKSSSFSLSYDMVFLALLRYKAQGILPKPDKIRCGLKKKDALESDPVLEYCGKAGTVLAYHKLRDDIADSKGLKKIKPFFLSLLFKKAWRKTELEELDRGVKADLEELSKLESEGDAIPDELAEVFGRLLSRVFSFGLEGDSFAVLEEAGRHIGRFIYLCDAVDDFKKDEKEKSFNPFKTLPDEKIIYNSLVLELDAAENAVSLLDKSEPQIENIIENVLRFGCCEKAGGVIKTTYLDRKDENDRSV